MNLFDVALGTEPTTRISPSHNQKKLMSCLMNHIQKNSSKTSESVDESIGAGRSIDPSVPPCSEKTGNHSTHDEMNGGLKVPSVPPDSEKIGNNSAHDETNGGLNVPSLPPIPDKIGKKSAHDETCDNVKEDVNIGSKRKAHQRNLTETRNQSELR